MTKQRKIPNMAGKLTEQLKLSTTTLILFTINR